MRTIAIGDIHGCYAELRKLIEELMIEGYYNPATDRLVFLGDYIDRGDDSRKVVKYIRELQDTYENVIALMGNHEDMLLSWYLYSDYLWTINGYETTVDSYEGETEALLSDIEWMNNLPLYFEDDYCVYVHAGINPNRKMEDQTRETLLWTREGFILNTKKYDKRVIFGHTPTMLLDGSSRPYITANEHIDIDTGCVYGGALTGMIIDDGKITAYYQIEKENEESNENEEAIA